MNAAILVENHKPLVVAEIESPEMLSFGQVRVKVHYSGICGAQINEIDAAKGPDKFLPHLLGHEGSGTVLAIGPGIKTVNPGDNVVMHWRPSSGLQCDPPTYDWHGRKVNAGWVTTFNDQAVVSENRLTVIPKDFNLKLAPLFGCAVTTAFGVINNDAGVKVGQSIAVFGVGGIGLNIVQAAQMVSAFPIVAIDLHDSKLEMSKKFGATHTIKSNQIKNLSSMIRNIVGDAGADVVVDTTGLSRIIETAYQTTHENGKTICVGVPKKEDNISIYSLPLHFNKVLTGSHGGDSVPDIEIPRYIRLLGANKMALDGLITHEFALEEINDALDLFRGGEAGRIILKMQ
ncbi:MAG: zinc-binding dehydrogenase [Desulfobacterales bacterium]|jgi:S-(hydroxymethyl)glutathione dehydrogenase/alcohol dehydrogenase|nr:zinc-binding dehydrogenase [Desulfobacterales bacterium]MDP6808214.1 zinc-binding dehydrogenase [Desulfobacterales bacterium]|tara:strand:+ start:10004 stop:11038 length:1035 start_codon:yes stop_codon:yes gene_type:complete